jgi:hypothetical protein
VWCVDICCKGDVLGMSSMFEDDFCGDIDCFIPTFVSFTLLGCSVQTYLPRCPRLRAVVYVRTHARTVELWCCSRLV